MSSNKLNGAEQPGGLDEETVNTLVPPGEEYALLEPTGEPSLRLPVLIFCEEETCGAGFPSFTQLFTHMGHEHCELRFIIWHRY